MIKKLIKKKQDIVDILTSMQTEESFSFWDSSLFLGNWGGTTRVEKVNVCSFTMYSWGKGWRDQAPTVCTSTTVTQYLWKHRKDLFRSFLKEN